MAESASSAAAELIGSTKTVGTASPASSDDDVESVRLRTGNLIVCRPCDGNDLQSYAWTFSDAQSPAVHELRRQLRALTTTTSDDDNTDDKKYAYDEQPLVDVVTRITSATGDGGGDQEFGSVRLLSQTSWSCDHPEFVEYVWMVE
jgi:hypothetical protein